MSFYTKPRFWIVLGVLFAALLLLQQIWHWEVERVEVQPEHFLVLVSRWGKELDKDEIVAPDDSYQGILLDVRPEGRHFINPFFYERRTEKAVNIPAGQCAILTRKYGTPIPADRLEGGDFLARDGERGIVKEVLLPGIHRINPYAYDFELIPAIQVKDNEVGVRTLKIGKDPRELKAEPGKGRYTVPEGYRGIQRNTIPSGTYYVNKFVEQITPVDTRSHKVELADIEFPSRDGFILKPHVQVEYQVKVESAPEMLVRITDEGVLNQEDTTKEQQEKNEILQKVILPHIRGYARIEGSNFDARDFIVTNRVAVAGAQKAANSREALQKALFTKIKPRCAELGIDILAVKLEKLDLPTELAQQIAERDLAKVEQNKQMATLNQFKTKQKLAAAEALKGQNKEKVEAATRLLQAKTRAEQQKQNEESKLKQDLEAAQLKLDAAKKQAEAILARGQADAAVVMAQNEAEVAGMKKAVQGFTSAQNYAQYQILSKLAPALTEIFASDESDFAKLFAGFMTTPDGPRAGAGKAPAMPPAGDGTGGK